MLDLDDEGQLIKGRHKVDLTPANLTFPHLQVSCSRAMVRAFANKPIL